MITITIITFGFQFLKSKEQITNFLPFFFPSFLNFLGNQTRGKNKEKPNRSRKEWILEVESTTYPMHAKTRPIQADRGV